MEVIKLNGAGAGSGILKSSPCRACVADADSTRNKHHFGSFFQFQHQGHAGFYKGGGGAGKAQTRQKCINKERHADQNRHTKLINAVQSAYVS